MNFTSPAKKIFVKWIATSLVLLAAPVFVGAQTTKKTTTPPPPPPKPAPAAKPAAAPPQTNSHPGTTTPTNHTTTTPTNHTPSTPTNHTPTPTNHTPPGPTIHETPRPINHTPPAPTSHTAATYVPRQGEQQKTLPGGRKEYTNPNGQKVVTSADGHVRTIESPRGLAGGKMVINRGSGGGRVVETGRPGARVVSYGAHRGFVERPLRQGYISRTYVYGGRSYAHVYREYRYHGVAYYRYVPGIYYGLRFYGWALTSWGAPVRYAWFGLANPAPWFGFYAGYFTPYPVYASPNLWLTDYLLAENLRLAYESQQGTDGNQAPPAMANAQGTSATLTPEMKQLIADEVRQQLDAERAAAAQPTSFSAQPASGGDEPPPALNQKFFIVSSSLDITTASGQVCSLTPGDIIQRKGKDVTPDGGVAVEVVSAKPGDCTADSAATVQVADLQEMHNQFREQLDAGLKMMADNQAKGLPAGPASGARPVADGTAAPAPEAQTQLAAQDADAAKVESQVKTGGGN